MPFQIIHKDLTLMDCDAIVNPTDPHFSGSGGTDFAVHSTAGEELSIECKSLKSLSTGDIAVTKGYKLPCKYVFHTVGPVWRGGTNNEEIILRGIYLNVMLKATKMGLESIAFPLISSGAYGFPKDKVLRIATDAISDFLLMSDTEIQVYICILDKNSYILRKENALNEFLGENRPRKIRSAGNIREEYRNDYSVQFAAQEISAPSENDVPQNLADWIANLDDTFAVTLLKLIDKKGMTDVECYKKANVSKGTFWKINNDPKYKPSKATVCAFAIALELNYKETENLLKTVGMALSDSKKFDKIIKFYILNENYDIFEINTALYKYDQVCLGC